MLLAAMAAGDENALICDFAESYHVYEWRKLPARYAAILAAGLKPDSRSKLSLRGERWGLQTMLLAAIADAARLLVWQRSQAAADGQPPPDSLCQMLYGKTATANSSSGFADEEEFCAWREKMLRGDENG